MTELIELLNYRIINYVYQLIICSLFLYVYNLLSSLFGLISTLINYKEVDNDLIVKKNK